MKTALLLIPLLACAEGLSVEERTALLNHDDADVRQRAVTGFLKELKESLAEDEPEAREDIADSMRRIDLTPEVMPLFHWFLDEAPSPCIIQRRSAFTDWRSPLQRALALRVLRKPHPDAQVLHDFLNEMALFKA